MASFSPELLQRMDAAREVTIETTRRDGSARKRVIWIVVDGDDVFVRSVRGDRGAWFRALLRRPGILHVADERVPVTGVLANDAHSVERCSALLRHKYPRSGASLAAMLRPEALPTTARLEPPAEEAPLPAT